MLVEVGGSRGSALDWVCDPPRLGLGLFVRSLARVERGTLEEALSAFLAEGCWTVQQTRFMHIHRGCQVSREAADAVVAVLADAQARAEVVKCTNAGGVG